VPTASPASAAALPTRPVILLATAAFASAATVRTLDPLVPAIAAEFATTPGSVGLTVTAFTLAYGVCQLFWGPVGDRLGKYRVIALASLLSAATAGAGALAGSLATLAALRLVSGVTAAAIIPLAMAFIGDHVPYAQRQATLARFIAGQILGLIGGQVIGGVVGDLFGWRAVFLVLAGLFLVPGLLLWRELRSGRVPPPVLSTPARPAQLALTYLRLVRRPWPRTVLLTVFAEGFLFFGAFAYVGLALHEAHGLTYSMVGLVLGAFGLGGVLYALNARALLARLGERGLARGGGALMALGFLALPLAPAAWLAAPAIGLLGLGFYLLHNTLQTNATQMAPEARGLAVSTFASCFFTGQGLGAWLGGLVVDGAGTAPLFAAVAPLLLLLALAFAHRLARRPVP
jgi:MFS transporter, YNFM family, putative membrane transport protein